MIHTLEFLKARLVKLSNPNLYKSLLIEQCTSRLQMLREAISYILYELGLNSY